MSKSFSVVICAYTPERWELLQRAVASVLTQDHVPLEVVVCIDHNSDLAQQARELWQAEPLVQVIENRYAGRLGSARNSALERVSGDIVAFLDDDACAEPAWLSKLLAVYDSDTDVHAVGGRPLPEYETARPDWFPYEFDWVYGCAYRGLPTSAQRVRRLIGANMSVRRDSVVAVGGFHSDNHDDMDLSHRLIDHFGSASLVYDPGIVVTHFVSAERVTWHYFWRRCLHVNRGKVLAFRDMAQAGNLHADLAFVRSTVFGAVPRYIVSGGSSGLRRAVATLAGIALAGLGNLAGRAELALGRTAPSATRGLTTVVPSTQPAVQI